MEKFNSMDEILDFAIERETEANQFYMDWAGRMEMPAMKKVFEDFAKEELEHKAKLQAMKESKAVSAEPPELELKIADYIVEIEPSPTMDYVDALRLAIQKEKASFRLYTDLAARIENQQQKKTFLALARQEAGHKLRFEIEYDDAVLKEI